MLLCRNFLVFIGPIYSPKSLLSDSGIPAIRLGSLIHLELNSTICRCCLFYSVFLTSVPKIKHVWIHAWGFNLISLINISVFMPKPCCFCYSSFCTFWDHFEMAILLEVFVVSDRFGCPVLCLLVFFVCVCMCFHIMLKNLSISVKNC